MAWESLYQFCRQKKTKFHKFKIQKKFVKLGAATFRSAEEVEAEEALVLAEEEAVAVVAAALPHFTVSKF